MSAHADVEVVLRLPDAMGESPAYDLANDRLLWVDILGRKVRQIRWPHGSQESARTWDMPDATGAVVPRTDGGFVAVVRTDVVVFDTDGVSTTLASLEQLVGEVDRSVVRFNDAKCDADGRLLAGWLAVDGSRRGGLVRIDGDGSMEALLDDVGQANGMGWSPDGGTYYFADTLAQSVTAYDYDRLTGTISRPRTFVEIAPGTGMPDGLCVDHEGYVWLAIPLVGEVRRFSPDGEFVSAVQTPTPLPLSCAFGGRRGEDLFITSGTWKPEALMHDNVWGLSPDQIRAWREDAIGGALLVCRPGVSGPPATAFALSS